MPIMFMVVPLLMGAVALWMLFSAVRTLIRNSSLARTGLTVEGRVASAHVKVSGGGRNSSATSQMVETVEFITGNGERIRGVPVSSDVGMLDREGEKVTVHHHRDRPELFIAPRNGRTMSPWGPIGRILFSFLFLGFVGVFLMFSLGVFNRMSDVMGG